MPGFTVTGKYFCACGAETYALMQGYQQGLNPRKQVVNCWQCGHIVGLAPATKVWTASTLQSARAKRLQGEHRQAVAKAPVAGHRSA